MELPGKQWKQVGQQEGNEKETPQEETTEVLWKLTGSGKYLGWRDSPDNVGQYWCLTEVPARYHTRRMIVGVYLSSSVMNCSVFSVESLIHIINSELNHWIISFM